MYPQIDFICNNAKQIEKVTAEQGTLTSQQREYIQVLLTEMQNALDDVTKAITKSERKVNAMTLKDYLLNLPESREYRLNYEFSCFCPECRKYVTSLDEEYSSVGTGESFRHDVNTSTDPECAHEYNHYRGYPWIYNDFETDDSRVTIEDSADAVTITIHMDGDDETCESCTEKLDADDDDPTPTPAIFADDKHRELYSSTLDRMSNTDCYHRSVAYLLSLDNVLRDHMTAVFDFEADVIKPDGIDAAFQTSTSRKTSRLIWNLWNGYDGNEELNEDGEPTDPTRYYTPDSLFGCSYLPYYLEAVRIRFEIFTPED